MSYCAGATTTTITSLLTQITAPPLRYRFGGHGEQVFNKYNIIITERHGRRCCLVEKHLNCGSGHRLCISFMGGNANLCLLACGLSPCTPPHHHLSTGKQRRIRYYSAGILIRSLEADLLPRFRFTSTVQFVYIFSGYGWAPQQGGCTL